MIITREVFDSIILGSSIYSTGGGLELTSQARMFSRKSRSMESVRVVSAEELDPKTYVCAAYGVGSAGNSDINLGRQLKSNRELLEEYSGKRLGAVFAGETNIDVLVFDAARELGLPVLDADCTGGRAVPEIQFDNFLAKKKSILPLAASAGDTSMLITRVGRIEDIDALVRSMATKSGEGSAAVIDHMIGLDDAKNILTMGIFSRSMEMGEFIRQNRDRDGIKQMLAKKANGRIIIDGTVESVSIKDHKDEGFLRGYYSVKDSKGNEAKIYVKNENIMCWINGNAVVLPPDSILTVDSSKLIGVHNSRIKNGQEVFIIAKKAEGVWATKAGRQLFSYKKFGLRIR